MRQRPRPPLNGTVKEETLMQMAQRKRQHEREEASEDEEYSEEEGEEYFEEGEEEERSFDPEEEPSESDDSRDDYWKRRSRSRYKHAPPPPPPPPLPNTPVVSPGFWFGHTHRALIAGPAVVGRWISARKQVWQEAERSRPGNLPKLFHEGGRLSQFRRQAWDEDHLRCLAINGLLKAHEFEHRRWLPVWGPKQPPEPAGGGSDSWRVILEPPPAKDHPFSDTSSCNSRQGGAMHQQPLAVVDNSQRSCGWRRASCR